MTETKLESGLKLPCGVRLENRLMKAPMTEGLADAKICVTPALQRLYERWAEGGCRLIVTGNLMVDARHLERPGNVVVNHRGHNELGKLAHAVTSKGAHLWAQLNHPGRQSPRRVNSTPVAPSAIPLNLPEKSLGSPRALQDEIEEVIENFSLAARRIKQAGFTGVQIHAAHGYAYVVQHRTASLESAMEARGDVQITPPVRASPPDDRRACPLS